MAKKTQLTRTQVERLSLFISRARRLPERESFKFLTSFKSSIQISWHEGEDVKLSNLRKPEVEQFRSFLIDFRPFVSKKEPVHVESILKICINKARHISFRERLILLREEWLSARSMISKVMRDDGISGEAEVLYTSEEHFQMWINGNIFHIDLEAESFFERQGELMTHLFEVRAAKYIGWCTNFIMQLASIIQIGLNNNDFDYVNEHTPHNVAKVVETVSENSKNAVIEFWKGTREFRQNFATCDEHDQDPIIVVTGYQEGVTDYTDVHVEIRACCHNAINSGLQTISNSLAWIEFLTQNPDYNAGSVTIKEIEVTSPTDIENIRQALLDYKLVWRRAVGSMRCAIHSMPPGVKAFGEDTFHQGHEKTYSGSAVYFQGCCKTFMGEVLERLTVFRTLETDSSK